jgi:hypothetical protein
MSRILAVPEARHGSVIVDTKETEKCNEHVKPDVKEVLLIYYQKFIPRHFVLSMVMIIFMIVMMGLLQEKLTIYELIVRESKNFPVLFGLMFSGLFNCFFNRSDFLFFIKKLQSFLI